MAITHRNVFLQIFLIGTLFYGLIRTAKTVNKDIANPDPISVDTSYYRCQCYWLRNLHVNFEVPLANSSNGNNDNETFNCSLIKFGIASAQNDEWKCRMIVTNTEAAIQPLDCGKISKEKSTSTGKDEDVTRIFTANPASTNAVRHGDSATLHCRFSAHAPWCYWTKDGDVVAIEDRYAFIGDKNDGNCSIEISNASLADDGSWTCNYPKTSHQGKLESESCTVKVVVMPTVPVISLNGLALKDGQKIYLSGTLNKPVPTTTDYYRRFNPTTKTPVREYLITGSVISCWAFNGKPAAELRWKANTDFSYSLVIAKSKKAQLFNSRITVPSDEIFATWQHTTLTCYMKESSDYSAHELKDYSTSVEVLLSIDNE